MTFNEITESLAPFAWQLTIVLFGLVFFGPLYKALHGLSSHLHRARIKIGDFEWSIPELDDLIVEREVLKTVVFIAAVDRDFSDPEKRFIEGRAAAMVDRTDSLSKEARKKILHEAINVTAADREIRSEEYVALRLRAREFNVDDVELDRLVLNKCLQARIKAPPELEDEYQAIRKSLVSESAAVGQIIG